MALKVNVIVKDKNGNVIYSEEFLAKEKSDFPDLSSSVAKKMVELEKKFPYPDYEVEQVLSFVFDQKQET